MEKAITTTTTTARIRRRQTGCKSKLYSGNSSTLICPVCLFVLFLFALLLPRLCYGFDIAMAQPHLQIFNSIQSKNNNKDSQFLYFQLLPVELRLKIWRHSLQRERIIKVSFVEQKPLTTDAAPKFDGTTVRHCAIVDGRQVLSKLLRVNHESRQETLMFYRVHFPCILRRSSTNKEELEETARLDTFYFNPEYDFLQIQTGFRAEQSLMDFLYHLKNTYDPHHIGLLNFAIGGINALKATDLCSINPLDVDAELRESFIQTLTQLQEVFFVEKVAAGRQILGYLSGLPCSKVIFNRSMPISTTTPTFDRLSRDPRPIAGDLEHAYIGEGPLRMLCIWQQLLRRWDISPTRTSYQFLLSFNPPFDPFEVHDLQSANKWVQKEDYEWTGKWQIDDSVDGIWATHKLKDGSICKHPITALYGKNINEDLEKAVKPAFGFWMFPIADAFGDVPSTNDELDRVSSKQFVNVSKIWPRLGLMSLS